MDAADRVAEGDYTTRVGEAPSRQFRRLTDGFNQMTERLQTNEKRRREQYHHGMRGNSQTPAQRAPDKKTRFAAQIPAHRAIQRERSETRGEPL